MANSSTSELLPPRVSKAAQDRVNAGVYQTLVFGVVSGNENQVFAFGKLDDGRAPTGDTVYEIASVTKTFTATLLADAILSGQLTLDTPVADLLPDFKIPERNSKTIRLDHTASHFSGLPRVPSNLKPKDPANPFADYDAVKLKAFLAEYELPRDPGESYEYSNLNSGLLGYALAHSAETTYDALLAERILWPLEMTMTGTVCSEPMLGQLAPGHDRAGNPAKSWDYGALEGAGAIRSTVNDIMRYLKANLGTTQTSLGRAMRLAHQVRRKKNENLQIGLAWFSNQGIIGHGGEPGGYRAFLGFRADGRKGAVILTNTAADVVDLGCATLIESTPLLPARKPARLTMASVEAHVGSYKADECPSLRISRADYQLYERVAGQDPFGIFASEPDEFFTGVVGTQLRFIRDANGAVNELILRQSDRDTRYVRTETL